MSRWEPNARARLEQAALELYTERGFEQTTVAEIAQRAGLVERTFFRHFADKREVLFAGSVSLQAVLRDTVAAAPAGTSPLEAVRAALEAAAQEVFTDRRPQARRRQRIIDADPGLRERDLLKLAALSEALAEGLRQRGTPEPVATLAAELGVVVLKSAYAGWLSGRGNLGTHVRACLDAVRAVAADADAAPARVAPPDKPIAVLARPSRARVRQGS